MKFSIFMMPLHHPTENPSLAFDRDILLIQYAADSGDTIIICHDTRLSGRRAFRIMKSRRVNCVADRAITVEPLGSVRGSESTRLQCTNRHIEQPVLVQ